MSIVYEPTLLLACFTASLMPLMIGWDAASSDPWSGSSMANLIVLPFPAPLHAPSAITATAASAPTLVSFMHSPPRNQPSRSPEYGPRSVRLRPSAVGFDPPSAPGSTISPEASRGTPIRRGRGGGARRQRLGDDRGRRAGGRRSDAVY